MDLLCNSLLETHDERLVIYRRCLGPGPNWESMMLVFLLLVPTSRCDGTEQPVAEEKRRNANKGEVSQRLKHCQVQEVAQVQAEYRWKSDVKSNSAQRELEIRNICSKFDPQC